MDNEQSLDADRFDRIARGLPKFCLLPRAVFKRIFFSCKEVKEEEDGHENDAVSSHHKATSTPLDLWKRDNKKGFQADTKTYLSIQVYNKENGVNGSMLVTIINIMTRFFKWLKR